MTGLKEQEDIFNLIGANLKRKIKCFVIGGSAMLYYKLKDATKDIDIVLSNENDRQYILELMKNLGYAERNPKILYVNKKNAPILLQRAENRFDLFNRTVIGLRFSDGMIDRSQLVYEYGNLVVNVVSPEDIIILKCATERAGDRLDAANIIKNTNVNWNILFQESFNQMALVGDATPLNLYQFLLELKEDLKVEVPVDFIKKLEKECEEILINKIEKGKTVKVTKYKK
ncbi:nucleotidyltransferase [Candidatus Woesearchaeota archaeon]|nr:nucleotidyltransferase [Candidatus Woesearchaeota archaeon]